MRLEEQSTRLWIASALGAHWNVGIPVILFIIKNDHCKQIGSRDALSATDRRQLKILLFSLVKCSWFMLYWYLVPTITKLVWAWRFKAIDIYSPICTQSRSPRWPLWNQKPGVRGPWGHCSPVSLLFASYACQRCLSQPFCLVHLLGLLCLSWDLSRSVNCKVPQVPFRKQMC